jgi:hypothetical protein
VAKNFGRMGSPAAIRNNADLKDMHLLAMLRRQKLSSLLSPGARAVITNYGSGPLLLFYRQLEEIFKKTVTVAD